jgi:archaeosortase A (PGF-CTERM-specific)
MIDALLGLLAWAHEFTYGLGWLVIGVFVLGVVLEQYDREWARPVVVTAWGLFAAFWFSMIEYFLIIQKSAIEGVGTIVAIPLCLYVGYRLATGRDSLFVLSRAIAAMGLIYVPFVTIPPLRQLLIEVVTDQTQAAIGLLGYDATVVEGLYLENGMRIVDKNYPYESTFLFWDDGHPITYTIRIACTGIGSMAVVAGLIAAVRAPLDRKLRALAIAIPIIWVLNIVRNVFISLSLGEQAMHVFPDLVMTLFAVSDPRMVSYFVADRVIAQSLSVVALVGITWLVVREVPEVLSILEDVIALVTGREYDLQSAMGV